MNCTKSATTPGSRKSFLRPAFQRSRDEATHRSCARAGCFGFNNSMLWPACEKPVTQCRTPRRANIKYQISAHRQSSSFETYHIHLSHDARCTHHELHLILHRSRDSVLLRDILGISTVQRLRLRCIQGSGAFHGNRYSGLW